jgi:uncharacterized repeat protein (TIGR03803 family)
MTSPRSLRIKSRTLIASVLSFAHGRNSGRLQVACIVTTFWIAAAIASPAQTFTTIHSFTGPTQGGAWPSAGLIQAVDGNFYGTTTSGGGGSCTFGCGTIFKLTPAGALTMLYSFQLPEWGPSSGLIQANNGNFYGTTAFGGGSSNCYEYNGCGTVYEITPEGMMTTLYSFNELAGPSSGVIQATDGNFYGTTYYGGDGSCASGCGTIFKITPEGTLTTLNSFAGTNGSGLAPGGLVQATDGNFYGTTLSGGSGSAYRLDGNGTVFEITPGGTLTTLYSFCAQINCADGGGPATLIQATDGNFYGTTLYGGAHGNGTAFKITAGGTLTTIYSFCADSNCSDGSEPTNLMQAANGNFYGTTLHGGGYGVGTIFEIIAGNLTPIYKFPPSAGSYPNGANPSAGVMQAADGSFYGTTIYGGTSSNCIDGCGTVFTFTVPAIKSATSTTISSNLNPSTYGQTITFIATVTLTGGSPPNGETVTFYNGANVLGTAPMSRGVASLTTSSLQAGVHAISAGYLGDANFTASTSPVLQQVVDAKGQSATSTTLTSSLNPSIYGQSVTWTAKLTTSGSIPPTGTVNFTWGDSIGGAPLNASGVATLTRSTENADVYPLSAVYEGDASNGPSVSAVLNQVIKEATSSATLTASPNPSTQSQIVTFTATISSPTVTATGPVTFTAGKTVLGTGQLKGRIATFTTSVLPVGSTAVTATYYGDSNIAESSATVVQTVKQ